MLAIAVVLVVLVTRAEATPRTRADDMALAKRYADILTGVDQDVAEQVVDDDDDGEAEPADDDSDSDDEELDDAPLPRRNLDESRIGADAATTATATASPDDDDVLADLVDDDSPALGDLTGIDLATLYPDPTELAAQSEAFQTAGGAELFDAWQRHQRPSRFGRLDLDVSWRSYASDPRIAPHYHSDELWLIATWRR